MSTETREKEFKLMFDWDEGQEFEFIGLTPLDDVSTKYIYTTNILKNFMTILYQSGVPDRLKD